MDGFLRLFAVSIVTLAVLMRLVVPTGFMPGQDEKGMIALTICKGADMVTIFVPADETPTQQHEETAQKDCAFSVTMAADMSAKKPVLASLLSPAWLDVSGASEQKISFLRVDHNDANPRAPPFFIA